jgi:hypothetical protein
LAAEIRPLLIALKIVERLTPQAVAALCKL